MKGILGRLEKGRTIYIWDAETPPPNNDGLTVLWRGFTTKENKNELSLPQFVEDHAVDLRSRYLAWIYELGEIQVQGKRIVDHLELRPGFSYWWMTLLSEKSIFKSPQIFDVIKLFALEDIQKEIKPKKIILISGNKQLADVFKKWCRAVAVQFEIHLMKIEKVRLPLFKHIYKYFPQHLQAVIGLIRHVFRRIPFQPNYTAATNNADITFIDYFINLQPGASKSGIFSSNYWTGLVDFLSLSKVSTNWLHIYVPHEDLNTPCSAKELMARFEQSSGYKEHHVMLDGVISFAMAFRIFKDYCKIVRATTHLKDFDKFFRPANSSLDLWDLYKKEWVQGVHGSIAMASLIHFNLFENLLAEVHQQKIGFFLLENQNWEVAMIYAWKKNGHGRLVGVPHSTVRFWDLRYFHDPRTYKQVNRNQLPLPDQVALNGPVAINEYIQGKYPKSQLLEVEALRYIYLVRENRKDNNHMITDGLNILVCGDIDPVASHKMIKWLEEIYTELPKGTKITVKAHPAQPISPEAYPNLPMILTIEPLGNILQDFDIIYVSYITSAAVDAYCFGLPVIQVLDGAAFNMSALRGLEGVTYVTRPMELAVALKSVNRRSVAPAGNFFYLDIHLSRWREILSPFILN
jgi:surface carbohydrate biosynthesis protein (TIGR04326 family)